MLDFRERMKATRRLAEPGHIDLYRSILSARGSRAASSVKTDRRVLAEELVYEILGYMTEEELAAAQNGVRTIGTAAASAVSGSPAPVKKKSINTRSIRISAGRIWTTLSSGLRTACSRTASTFGRIFARSKTAFMKLRSRPTH